jgi:serine/tyrosine/threonine adenylyltransferase
VIAQWNLARFAETLLPLIDADADKAVGLATAVLEPFIDQFDALFLAGMRRKLGLSSAMEGDAELVRNLLNTMQSSRADFTLTFRSLSLLVADPGQQTRVRELFSPTSNIDGWLRSWQERLASDPQTMSERAANMRAANPAYIPRNHRVEAALQAAEGGDPGPFFRLLAVLQRPHDNQPEMAAEYGQLPQPSERVLQTFCGT